MKGSCVEQTVISIGFIVSMAFVCAATWLWGGISDNRKIILATNTLRSLYEFTDLEQFGANIENFRANVTLEVFNVMTADNADRVLRVYLKFNGKPCYVNVIEATPDHIIYSLVCESIERERVFLFAYEVTGGKISKISEAEIFRFPTTRDWEVDMSLPYPAEIPLGGV